MNLKPFLLLSLLFTATVFGQQINMFSEASADISKQFINAESLREITMEDRYGKLTRSEGLLVSDVVTSGSVFTRKLHLSGKVIFNCPAGEYLNKLKSRLLTDYPAVDQLIHVYITEDASLNAFATVNNNIYVNIGLLARIENEAQLAFILCHEIMHVVNAHIINETLKINKQETVFTESSVTINDELLLLKRHELSRSHETEADVDGFTLFLKQGYDPKEGVYALDLLERANDYAMSIPLSKELLFITDDSEYAALLTSFKEKKTKKVNNEGSNSTHPLIEDRIAKMTAIIDQMDQKKGSGLQYLVSETDFQLIQAQALKMVDEIYLQDLDFISLFLNSSARLRNLKDLSDKNADHLAYAVQGLLIDRFTGVEISNARSSNAADSVLSYFYKTASKEDFSKWTYGVINTLATSNPENAKIQKYHAVITQTIVSELGHTNRVFGKDSVNIDWKPKVATADLQLDKIEFEITPYSDISIFKAAKFNENQKQKELQQGKLAIIGMNMAYIRRKQALTNDYTMDMDKVEVYEQRGNKVCENLEEDYAGKAINLVPNTNGYKSSEYKKYDMLNQWMSERVYFNNRLYVSAYEEDINQILKEDQVRYAMSSINVSVKSFSVKAFLASYFAPFVIPMYVPQLAAHVAGSSTRKYNLSLVFDLENGNLVYWDRRTYLEANSIAQLQVIYNDILNTFFKK